MKYLSLLTAIPLAAFNATATIPIEMVYVGDPGNPNDSSGFGGVSYGYFIGTYEVTNSQYAAFLNAVGAADSYGLYDSSMGTHGGIIRNGLFGNYTYSTVKGMEEHPVISVGYWSAARFANWLTNGQPTGITDETTTERGMYTLDGQHTPSSTAKPRNVTAWTNGGVAIANENEWYKAAYYSGVTKGADGDGYWMYPVQSNSVTTADANFDNSIGTPSSVGSFGNDPSFYGTFDQGGNLWEIVEDEESDLGRILRGGSYLGGEYGLRSSFRGTGFDPTQISLATGFRVTSLQPIPEPMTCAAILGGLGLLIALVRRPSRRLR